MQDPARGTQFSSSLNPVYRRKNSAYSFQVWRVRALILNRSLADFSVYPEQGYDLTFRAPKEVTPKVIEDDIPSFAHVILFAPESKGKLAVRRMIIY